jgi:hypothetical protein
MGPEPQTEHWNYFNYFTEVEEHFQRVRGTGLFLLSPLDWALLESWKNEGIPLEAVLRGLDTAFERWRSRKRRRRDINSVAYCAQAVHQEAQAIADSGAGRPRQPAKPPFEVEDVRQHLQRCAADLRARPGYQDLADTLDALAADAQAHFSDLEQLEQRLTALEEKMTALAKANQSGDDLLAARQQMDASLRPYRSSMTAEQLEMLERQYLDRRTLESAGLPRLSLFYLR